MVPVRTPFRLLLPLLILLMGALLLTPRADATTGNSSAAAGFLEDAQNADGGFGTTSGGRSDPQASLWAAVALLAGGKHPLDEFDKGGDSLDGYLREQRYSSVRDLGLLALVQAGAGYGPVRYGDPAAKLKAKVTDAVAKADPGAAALAALGLQATGDGDTAKAVAAVLLASPQADGGWGPEALSDSESTALVLQAIAKTGVGDAAAEPVKRGLAYLQQAQGNDGAILTSIRTDPASAGGSVTATAFALQALGALGLPAFKTATGKTVRQGLTQYQQQTTGGLSSNGSLYDSTFAPSVTETAQAFAAFNGSTFPLDTVKPSTSGPPKKQAATTKAKSKQLSSGTAEKGVADKRGQSTKDQGAFQNAKAGEQGTAKRGTEDRKGSAKTGSTSESGPDGTAVSGAVVGATSAPKLATRAGQDDSGTSNQTKAAITLAGLLLACGLAGAVLGVRRPGLDERSGVQVALVALAALGARARARGALAPGAVVVVGLALVAVPFATHMWDRAPQGADLIEAYAPHLEPAKVRAYQRDLRDLDAGVRQAQEKGPKVLHPTLSAAAAKKRLASDAPTLAGVTESWPKTSASLHGVVDPIAAHREGYDAIAALPPFTLFPWFFVVPGGLLVAFGLVGLSLPRAWRLARWGAVAVAAGLVVAPFAFQLWERAPKGAAMVDAFRPIETREAVVRVQNDFGQVALLQGALAGELVPQLQAKAGYGTKELRRSFPALQTVDRRFVDILGDLTPVLGAMSDNVTRFQAVAALPALTVFPWLLTVPGLLVLLLLAASGRRRRRPSRAAPVTVRPEPTRTPEPKEQLVSLTRLRTITGLTLATVLLGGGGTAQAKTELKGTLGISPGKPATKAQQKKSRAKYTGSYFRMVLPGGTDKFFSNGDSRAKDKTYTLFRPGKQKGLKLGAFQNPPSPAFGGKGFALANAIVLPESFVGIDFGISTAAKDAQTAQADTPPRLYVTGKKISGDLRAWTAEWNSIYFNQGAPKPNGSLPGFTKPVNGTYDPKTKAYEISWSSSIVGGPFNGFTGFWHLQGKLLK